MAFIGADTEALRDAGARHATTATTIGQLAGSLGSSIQRPEIWMGMDGEAFRARYSAELSPSLRALEELLRVRAQELEAQAAEQDAASNAGSGVSLADSLGTAPLFSSPGRPLPPVQNEASGRGAREESTEATTPHPNDEFKTEGPPCNAEGWLRARRRSSRYRGRCAAAARVGAHARWCWRA